MPQKPMDFNPLDILAAAALGEKDGSSNITNEEEGSSAVAVSSGESKDAEDDPEDMGKTSQIYLNSQIELKFKDSTEMPSQKTQWSPESFLAPTHMGNLDVKHGKLSFVELVQDLKNSTYGIKDQYLSLPDSNISNGSLNNNLVTVKNAVNLKKDVMSLPLIGQPDLYSNTICTIPVTAENGITEPARENTETPHPIMENVEQTSGTDIADSSGTTKSAGLEHRCSWTIDCIGLDHPYALVPGGPGPSSSVDPFDEEDDVDVCSQSSPLTEETEQRSRNLSLDCNYLKSGILEGVSASTIDLYKMSSLGRGRLPSSSSSTSSPSHERSGKEEDSADCNNPSDMSSPEKPCPKFGKFRIGTFASFSSNNMELEKYLRNKDSLPNNDKKINIGIPSDTNVISSYLSSPTASPSIHPLLRSPILDWDRSEAGSEVQDDSSESRTPHRLSPDFTQEKVTEWSHPLFHDHDYCLKDGEVKLDIENSPKCNTAKRKYTKRKSKFDLANQEKILKARYLKKELLKQEPFKKTSPEIDLTVSESSVLKTNPVGRPKKRQLEKPVEEEIDPETGAKMKITGKFQDQYVYYLSKSFRTTSRRRQTPLPFPLDKIIVPAPKPGDIIVPHLTDADIETVRLKGRASLNLPERPQMTHAIPPVVPVSSQSGDLISDVDSHIVSTILSMENDNLASSPSPEHTDVADASGLNPNQPALTESLRLMSGDCSITSEHVLNYLLSVVKEDDSSDNILSVHGLDTSSSALFPSLSSESIYSKVDHLEVTDLAHPTQSAETHTKLSNCGELLRDETKPSPNTISNSIHTPPIHDSDNFTSSLQKEDSEHLPEDLSSFISNSQGTTSSTSVTTQDEDSHSSLKSMFGSDLSSLGTPQLSSSFPRLTSIEKTLDYLGVKDGDIKLDSDVFNSKLQSQTDSSNVLTSEQSLSAEDNTPWIVTVTLYFNDVPAIMINYRPFIRLVDIHKQILPAKDTGILKKRCQLLKIPVLNCSEMQRYFLVQYGRAYNSKSTLVISKDQATDLVTYYATPQPRIGKLGEGPNLLQRSGSKGSDAVLPSNGLTSGAPKKKGNKNGRKNVLPNGVLMLEMGGQPSAEAQKDQSASDTGPSSSQVSCKRTRHKKINYLEMLRGEEKNSSEDAILETIERVVRSAPDYIEHQCDKVNKNKSVSNSKLPSKKKFKKNLCDKNKRKKKSNLSKSKFNSKQHERGPKLNKDKLVENVVHKIKGNKMEMRESDNSVVKPRGLASDSEGSLYLSQSKSKFRPLKLKVHSLFNFASQRKASTSSTKKGLFSRKNSLSSQSNERHLRVLAVAHQAALAESEYHLPSQPADIHLDLFIKSSSPCVRCQTCSQFLSVPHFMRHHHVPIDNEWLATEAAHRILVPRNKENISEQEKRLWEEFHTLQEAIGGFGEGDDDESDSDVDSGDEFEVDNDNNSLSMSGASSIMSSARNPANQQPTVSGLSSHGNSHTNQVEDEASSSSDGDDDEEFASPYANNQPDSSNMDVSLSSPSNTVAGVDAQKLKNEMASKIGLVRRLPVRPSDNGISTTRKVEVQNSNLRTSSRKRKSKQLFSIENYYVPKRSAHEDESNHLSYSSANSVTAESEVVLSNSRNARLSV